MTQKLKLHCAIFSALIWIVIFLSGGCSTTKKIPGEETSNGSSSENGPNQYLALYDQFINLEPDFEKTATVHNFSFQRDAATFNLADGKLYLCKPVMGRVCAAVFIGEGNFQCTPPTEVERKQLYRYYETESLNQQFKFMFIIFADNTLSEFSKTLNFTPGEKTGSARSQIEDAMDYMGESKGKEFNPEIMKTFLNSESNDLFYAHFGKKSSSPLFFEINPYESEAISIMRRSESDRIAHTRELICQFHKQEDYKSVKDLNFEFDNTIRVVDYKIDANVAKNIDFSASAEMKFVSLEDKQSWINLYIYNEFEIDSVSWADGGKIQFFKGKENPCIWIKCPQPLLKDQTYSIKIAYHGELISKERIEIPVFTRNGVRNISDYNKDWLSLKTSSGWYPWLQNRDKATFDITFKVPEDYDIVSIGKNTSSKTENEFTTTRWVTNKPIRNASFNIGKFNRYKISDARIPTTTVLTSKFYSQFIETYLRQVGNADEMVGADITNSMNFFQVVFGKNSLEEFYATETPSSLYTIHGVAFPGLINLSWTTFQTLTPETETLNKIVRAHEVAHQWWGIGVDFKTYHDQWLSEGFAQYSGLWYAQIFLRDNKTFFDTLDKWKDKIISSRHPLFNSSMEAGPIGLGYRTSNTMSTARQGYYDLIIYKKGAWVLHMLRNMLIDQNTMNEEEFIKLMTEFYTTYQDKKVSTYDFQKIVEKYIGADMDWFFKQWVYGTDIPTYKFAYKTEKTLTGEFEVTCKVEQLDVPDDFQMIIPLNIEFPGDQFSKTRIRVKGPLTTVKLPLMPYEPEKITFNDLDSVLCEVKNVRWK